MAHDFALLAQGTVSSVLRLPLPDTAAAHTLSTYVVTVSENGVVVADPVADLSLALTEVSALDALGLYQISVTPRAAGTLYLRFVRALVEYEYALQVDDPAFSDANLEGDYTVTADDGGGPVPGATIRVFDAPGTRLVQRGVTDSNGQVTFYGLPVGSYQVRAYKDGVDFSSINPTAIVVVSNESEAPKLTEVLPLTASVGDVILLSGSFFDPLDTQVRFGAEATVSADYVNAAGTLLLVTVPALTGMVFSLRVDKEDPLAPPARLISNSITWTRT